MITIPNEILFAEVIAAIRRGECVTIRLVGDSMRPLLTSQQDYITLSPIDSPLRRSDIVLFNYHGQYILHRIIRITPTLITLQGDNCHDVERVIPSHIVARLTAVIFNGTHEVTCNSKQWKHLSRKSLSHKRVTHLIYYAKRVCYSVVKPIKKLVRP